MLSHPDLRFRYTSRRLLLPFNPLLPVFFHLLHSFLPIYYRIVE